ncbi:hypothetical protein C8J56DRAFT_1054484 [Mycena floridula]|nr:hypothetical protein C8J56DRAFT_1054484 [Mycena floridula]
MNSRDSSQMNEVKSMTDSKPPDGDIHIPLCDRIPDWVLRGYLTNQVFRDTVSRSIKPPRRLLPPGWKTNWFGWQEQDDLRCIATRCRAEIFLREMFDIVFQHIQLIMYYDSNSIYDPIVFLYHGRFYKYDMVESDLFIYPDRYTTVKDFLQDWEAAKRDLKQVAEIRDERYCGVILCEQATLAPIYMNGVHRRWGRKGASNLENAELVRIARRVKITWRQRWVYTITRWLSNMFGYWFPI